jgi:hypothetical protein
MTQDSPPHDSSPDVALREVNPQAATYHKQTSVRHRCCCPFSLAFSFLRLDFPFSLQGKSSIEIKQRFPPQLSVSRAPSYPFPRSTPLFKFNRSQPIKSSQTSSPKRTGRPLQAFPDTSTTSVHLVKSDHQLHLLFVSSVFQDVYCRREPSR